LTGGVAVLAATAAFGHGASKGLHLHVTPEAAKPGGEIEVRVDAVEPVVSLTLSVADGEPVRVVPDRPVKSVTAPLAVPLEAMGNAVNVQAEAVTRSGRTLRASAVVRLSTGKAPPGGPGQRAQVKPPPPQEEAPPPDPPLDAEKTEKIFSTEADSQAGHVSPCPVSPTGLRSSKTSRHSRQRNS
jgi:hypothetical protein